MDQTYSPPKTPKTGKDIKIYKTYGTEMWDSINDTILKNKIKAQQLNFQTRYQ